MQFSVPSMSATTLTEIFPITVAALPVLTAYHLKVRNGDLATIGGKLSYRFQKALPGHWVWTDPWVVTDQAQPIEALKPIIETAWREQPDFFRGLLDVQTVANWQQTAQVSADFVARGLWPDLKPTLTQLLNQWNRSLGAIRISRACEVRGWVVQGEPALSLSIDSRLLSNQDVQTYLRKAASPDAILDLMVADKESSLKGTITGIVGTVVENRGRLLNIVGDRPSRTHILAAVDHETVVNVYATNRSMYEYVARGLNIIVRTSDYARFRVDGPAATAQLRLAPQQRSEMISQLAQLAKKQGIIGAAYSSAKHPRLFLNSSSVHFAPNLLIGNKRQISDGTDRSIQASLRTAGLYKRVMPKEGEPLRIGVLNALTAVDPISFVSALQNELRLCKFVSEVLPIEKVTDLERHTLDRGIQTLQTLGAHLILALFPDDVTVSSNEMQWGPYDHFKSLTIGADIPSQVVHASTLSNTFAIGNIALGILSKLGNIPYILSTPLPYADIVVGIDIARRRKTRLSGSLNATAIARIYQNTGEFLQYVIHDAQLEGETIPAAVLHTLFPPAIFAGKQVVVHRDGLFRGEEKQALKTWAAYLKAQFHLVEILKTGTPRLYQFLSQAQKPLVMQQPVKGSAVKLSNHEAFLISSLPPFTNVTPYPIHIRCEAPFQIEEAIHSVLSLTTLHYGSLRTPRLPVTIHYSDEIAYLALKGIKPKSLEGSLPFWL